MKKMRVRLTFTEPVLGTSPGNENIYREFIGSKAPDAATVDEEVAALGADAVVEKGMTVFSRMEDGRPALMDFQIKGFFKDSAGGLRKVPGTCSSRVRAYKKQIDKLIFVQPRRIPLEFDGEVTTLQRPLRAQTMQGERVTLSISEQVPAGTVCEFDILMLDGGDEPMVREWLDYGALSGIGQWRNSGMGRFTWELLDLKEEKIPAAEKKEEKVSA